MLEYVKKRRNNKLNLELEDNSLKEEQSMPLHTTIRFSGDVEVVFRIFLEQCEKLLERLEQISTHIIFILWISCVGVRERKSRPNRLVNV